MNYLGHLLVLPHHGLITLGNLLGDFVKGRPDHIEPRDFRLGLILHRELDRYTDAHPAVQRTKQRFPAHLRRLSGILTDIFYDHFLVRDVDLAAHRESLLPYVSQLPELLQPLPERMITSRWFGSYADIEGIGVVLSRMDQRRKTPLGLTGAESELRLHYSDLERDATNFFPDAIAFTKEALLRLQSASRAEPPSDAATATASDPLETS